MNAVLDLEALAERLDGAQRQRRETDQLTLDHPGLDLDAAYAVQAQLIARRCARGERRVGVKMGLTSAAKMRQVGVDEVIWGVLTDAMLRPEGGAIDMADFIHPRAEPEIAFLLRRPLHGAVSAIEAFSAIEAVAPAIEIIDSRYRNFRFAVSDVVADNSSSSAFLLGAWAKPGRDIANLGILLSIDGRPAQFGSTAAILGHPLRALIAAAEMTARQGGAGLAAGEIVLAGAATAAEPLRPGMHVRSQVQHLGQVSFTVKGTS